MGYVLDKLGNYESSLEAFDRAIELAPDNEKYVQSRKAVEATWREFQSVFDNASTTSASSSTTNTSSIGNSIDIANSSTSNTAGLHSQQQNSIAPQTSPTLSHANHGGNNTSTNIHSSHQSGGGAGNYRPRSGSAPNGEIAPNYSSNASNFSGNVSNFGATVSSHHHLNHHHQTQPQHYSQPQQTHKQHPSKSISSSRHVVGSSSSSNLQTTLSSGDLTEFNPFLDFESSSLPLSSVSELISSAPPAALSRPATPPVLISSNPSSLVPPATVKDSNSDLTLDSIEDQCEPQSVDAISAQAAAANLGFDSGEQMMPIALQPMSGAHQSMGGRLDLEEPHFAYIPHISQLRSSNHSVSNSSPAITLSHLAPDRSQPTSNSSSGGNTGANTTKESRHASSGVSSRHRQSHAASTIDDSNSGSNIDTSVSGVGSFQPPQMLQQHSRSMSAATVVSPRGHHSSSSHRGTSNSSNNNNTSLSTHGGSGSAQNSELGVPSHMSSDAGSILNAIHQATSGCNNNGSNLGSQMASQQLPSSSNQTSSNSPLVPSPDGSDGEHDLVHVGLPRARTYLEAIYSHLQNVKTVKDAEKLEKALEEMLAAVRVKRSFLNTKKSSENEDKCACCWEHPPEMVCIPCGHLCICEECKYKLRQKKCPICSQPVKNIYKVFK